MQNIFKSGFIILFLILLIDWSKPVFWGPYFFSLCFSCLLCLLWSNLLYIFRSIYMFDESWQQLILVKCHFTFTSYWYCLHYMWNAKLMRVFHIDIRIHIYYAGIFVILLAFFTSKSVHSIFPHKNRCNISSFPFWRDSYSISVNITPIPLLE